jgi:hypothetical protein
MHGHGHGNDANILNLYTADINTYCVDLIDYIFNDKTRKYRVDFKINDILIEIKDFHIWHKNQVESGQWSQKINAVENYVKENGLKKYFFITPNNWNQMLSELKNIIN